MRSFGGSLTNYYFSKVVNGGLPIAIGRNKAVFHLASYRRNVVANTDETKTLIDLLFIKTKFQRYEDKKETIENDDHYNVSIYSND